jgi:WD40 repeat protein
LYRMLAGQDLQGDLKHGLIIRRYRYNPVATFFRGKCGRSKNMNMNMIMISQVSRNVNMNVNANVAGGNDYEYPVWIRSLALRVRRERKKSKIALLDSLTVKDSASRKVLKKPTDILRCVRYHPSDKSTFASSGDDGVVRIWTVRDTVIEGTVERAEVKLHSSFEAHPAPIHSLAFHPNFEGCIITASCTVKLWNYVAKESSYQKVLSLPACAKCATCVDIWAVEKSVSATLVVGNCAGVILTWSLEITPLGTSVIPMLWPIIFSRPLILNF